MIKVSALLVALAIGLLVAGVLASSLLMVYVSIGVCAVAALLLAVGVLAHWSEIFGQREARPAAQGAWSEPQVNVTAPVLASIQAVAAARGSGRPGREEAGARPAHPGRRRPDGGRQSGGWPDSARVPEGPAEVVPFPPEVAGRGDEFPAARRSEDLWERVEEELGSAARRDTGALSWPGAVFPPVPPDLPEPAESAAPAPEALAARPGGPGDTPPGPPVPDETDAEPGADADLAQDDEVTGDAAPVPDDAAGPGVAEDAEPVPDDEAVPDDAGDAGPVADDEAVPDDAGDAGPVADDEAVPEAGDHEAADGEPAGPADADALAVGPADADDAIVGPADADDAVVGPADAEELVVGPADADELVVEDQDAEELAAGEPAAEEAAAKEPAVQEPSPGAPEVADEESASQNAAAQPASRRVEVAVVPGVARYHRSECILIRFLGAGDLEIMTRQEAVEAEFMACRACQPDKLED